jgi:hypothetical protein
VNLPERRIAHDGTTDDDDDDDDDDDKLPVGVSDRMTAVSLEKGPNVQHKHVLPTIVICVYSAPKAFAIVGTLML